jgi:hypothetical protein
VVVRCAASTKNGASGSQRRAAKAHKDHWAKEHPTQREIISGTIKQEITPTLPTTNNKPAPQGERIKFARR